jgi:predicted Zn-dependent peptidase
MHKTFVLKNGVKVATYNLPQLRSIYVLSSVLGGAIEESADKNGVAHFMEHMIVQGTPSLPTAEEFSSFVESLSGSYGATTSLLQVNFSIGLPKFHLEDAIRLTSEVLFEPLFPEEAIEKERQAIFDEISQRMDSHYFKIAEFFKQTRFKKGSPLQMYEGGSIETVQKLTRADLMGYWKKFFIPSNTYLVVVGSFNEKHLLEYLEKYFKRHKDKSKIKSFSPLKDVFSGSGVFLRKDENLKVNYLDLTFPSVSMQMPLKERIIQHLAMVILGGLRNSRLFRLLRYQLGLVYGVSSSGVVLPQCGYGYITAQSLPERTDQVFTLIAQELSSFVNNGPLEEELQFAKNYLSNQWLMAFDHPSSIAGWLENDLLWNGKIFLPEEYIELIKDITPQKMTGFMKKHWDFKKVNLVIQGQIDESKVAENNYSSILKSLQKIN